MESEVKNILIRREIHSPDARTEGAQPLSCSLNLLFNDLPLPSWVHHTYPDIFNPQLFFPDTASVHAHRANSAANQDIFESALHGWTGKCLNPKRKSCGLKNIRIRLTTQNLLFHVVVLQRTAKKCTKN